MMAKFLRIPSFHCCRSHDISVAPTDQPPPPPHHSFLRRHVSSAFRTASCGCRSSSTNSDDDQNTKTPSNLPRHVPPTPLTGPHVDALTPSKQPRRRKKKKKKKSKSRLRISTSSAESGLFSSESFGEMDELEETENLICSSKTISTTDGDDSNPQLKEKNRNNRRHKQRRRTRRTASPESSSPARLSMFQRLIPCTVEGKIRESFAVVKKSEDPFEDFKRSMMEMIMEKEMFHEKDLEQLLHCFLSLNHREHHQIIVQAFSQIWESLFCNRSTCRTSF